jgi:agmatine deiminase
MAIHIPPEWAPHKTIWTCWPSAADLWQENLFAARAEVAAMIHALIAPGPRGQAGDVVHVLACGSEAFANARAWLAPQVFVHELAFGDIWLRDTGPIFAKQDGKPIALRFQFNGWGEKYLLEHDDQVGDGVARLANTSVQAAPFVLEGGAVDHDGEGTILTTRQCVLNPNRTNKWTNTEAEAALMQALGAKKILWLGDGLLNDHTDGHVDNIARFVGPGRVMCMAPFGEDDPNRAQLAQIAFDLSQMTDSAGRQLEVIGVPSPGLILDAEGEAIPASHMNFIIGNASVVVPHYGAASTDEALRAIGRAFPDHRVVGIKSSAILTGGGSFHCITQQEPA